MCETLRLRLKRKRNYKHHKHIDHCKSVFVPEDLYGNENLKIIKSMLLREFQLTFRQCCLLHGTKLYVNGIVRELFSFAMASFS